MTAPYRFAAFAASAGKLAVAGQLGNQAFNRERGAVHLNEALLIDDVPLVGPRVVQHRIGDQRAAGAAATTVERMGDLMPPGERAEIVTPLARRAQEADANLIDGEGVGPQRSGRLLRGEDLRPALDLAGVENVISAALGQEPKATGSATRFGIGDQARALQVGQDLLSAPDATIREVDRAHLRGREGAMFAKRGNQLSGPLKPAAAFQLTQTPRAFDRRRSAAKPARSR